MIGLIRIFAGITQLLVHLLKSLIVTISTLSNSSQADADCIVIIYITAAAQ